MHLRRICKKNNRCFYALEKDLEGSKKSDAVLKREENTCALSLSRPKVMGLSSQVDWLALARSTEIYLWEQNGRQRMWGQILGGGQLRRGRLEKFSSDCFNISVTGYHGQQLRLKIGRKWGFKKRTEDAN